MVYAALFNESYVPNRLEASYLANPTKFLAPYLFGGMIAQFLFGVFTCQVVNYYSAFGASDPLHLQAHVAIVVLLTIFKIVQIILSLWKRHVVDWGNFFQLTQMEPDTKITSLSSVLVTIAVQIFFINRAFHLSHHSYFFLVPVVACCALSLGASVWISDSFINASRMFPAASVATDGLITIFSMYYLVRAKSGLVSKATENLVSRLIWVTLQSAFPPLVTASLSAGFTGQTLGPYVFMCHCSTPLLEAFSMMYTLNCRAELRRAVTSANGQSIDLVTTVRWRRDDVTISRTTGTDVIKLQDTIDINVPRTVDEEEDVEQNDQGSSRWYTDSVKQDPHDS
ncbi:hypothetical protein BDZ89DRAFT_1066616 [Hymenopellis radicata]|nr:hypothetical protein BDZ89DRAFT_1066616 [Hymenopellis radicata]